MASFLGAEEPVKSFPWDAPKVVASVFTQELGMLDSEREEYATNLATIASNHLSAAKASPASAASKICFEVNSSPKLDKVGDWQISTRGLGDFPLPIISSAPRSKVVKRSSGKRLESGSMTVIWGELRLRLEVLEDV